MAYNGYRNKETWLVTNFILNNEDELLRWKEEVEGLLNMSPFDTPRDALLDDFGYEIEAYYDLELDNTDSELANELLLEIKAHVDWHEVASTIFEEYSEETGEKKFE